MIQINLLPDVKQNFIKAKRTQNFITTVMLVVTAAAIGLFVMLFLTVNVWQKQRIKHLNNQISESSEKLKGVKDLDRILTVQQQLNSLTGLHDQKPATKKLFDYISQITPASVTISKLSISFETSKMEVSGEAAKIQDINKYADTLKFTKYKVGADGAETAAFKNVVLSSFGRGEKNATYTISFEFDPVIFDSRQKDLVLAVPQNFITTRSETERPQALFDFTEPPKKNEGN